VSGPLARKWDLFSAAVLPTDASAIQRKEMRRAFYAGAEAMRQVLLDAPDDEAGELALCDSVEADFMAFAAAVQSGQA
jgi:hypothetical protein